MERNPDSEIEKLFCLWNPMTGNFRFWNPESWPLQSGKQLKESGIHLKIGIRNNRSTDKVGYLESGIHGLESRIQACLVFPYKEILFNAGRYLFRFRRLRYCGKQRKLLEDFKKLAVSCGTKREFYLETLLACICRRMGGKYISLTM